jgi:hypothetical protein
LGKADLFQLLLFVFLWFSLFLFWFRKFFSHRINCKQFYFLCKQEFVIWYQNWYNKGTLKQQKTTPKCFHCGSALILVSEVTELREGSRFPQTTIKYRCSNQECQDEIDKQTAKRMKILEDKAINDQKRLEKKQHDKMQLEKMELEKTK